MLQRPNGRYERVKHPPQCCFNLRAILVNHMFEHRCRDNEDGGREHDTPVDLCELAGVPVRIEPQDEKHADIHLDVVFDICKIGWLGFHEAYENNRVCHMDEENGPQVCRRVQVPEIHH